MAIKWQKSWFRQHDTKLFRNITCCVSHSINGYLWKADSYYAAQQVLSLLDMMENQYCYYIRWGSLLSLCCKVCVQLAGQLNTKDLMAQTGWKHLYFTPFSTTVGLVFLETRNQYVPGNSCHLLKHVTPKCGTWMDRQTDGQTDRWSLFFSLWKKAEQKGGCIKSWIKSIIFKYRFMFIENASQYWDILKKKNLEDIW